MKKTKFIVVFLDNTELEIYASSAIQAMYLGSAKKIELGEVFTVDAVFNTETREFYSTNKNIIHTILTKTS